MVSQASSVAEGRKKMAQGGGIDAAIVSIPLPDEGAEEFVRELHEANPSIPVLVMLTDLVEDPEIRPRFLGAGAREVGSKEASLAEVLAALRRLGGEGGRDVEEEALETRGDALAPVFLVCVALYSPYYCLEKLSEKGYEQRSEREFGRYTEEEIGPWVVCRATLQALSTLFGHFRKRSSPKSTYENLHSPD